MTGHGTEGLVERAGDVGIERIERAGPRGDIVERGCETVVVGILRRVGVVGHHAVGGDKVKEHGHHAARADSGLSAGEIAAAGLLGEPVAGHIVRGEVDRVAAHDMLGLYGGKHGIGPTQRTAALILDRGEG